MRMVTPLLPLLAACAIGGDVDDPVAISALSGTASVKLSNASVAATQTTDSAWTLDKVGSLSGTTVSWTITATKTATVSGHLVLQGHMTVTNTGSGPATIGNIVVNLQTRQNNKWVTRSSDIANATDGDDATSANIHSQASSEGLGSFTENAASGSLQFMDATNNTVFSLVPQVQIPAGGSRALLFQAAFDNNVLALAAGTQIRSEVIVSFGNAVTSSASTANVDINGNGTIDADEARVRSVPSRLPVTVPAATPGNGTVTLSDTLSDIVATGDVTFTNVNINLGATSGTVTATVNGGTNGGTITNCAHLTGASSTVSSGGFVFPVVNGVDLEACDTVTVAGNGGGGGDPCTTPGAPGCGWEPGELVTRSQLAWDTSTGWFSAYDDVYAATFGVVEVGIPGTSGFSMRFTAPTFITSYLVAFGAVGSLSADLVDPSTTSSGTFGGEVLALRLNLDFSAAGALGGSAGVRYGDVTLCNMTDSSLNGLTVAQFAGLVNTLLGGGNTGHSISALSTVTSQLNSAFLDGSVSTFAQEHLVNGACP